MEVDRPQHECDGTCYMGTKMRELLQELANDTFWHETLLDTAYEVAEKYEALLAAEREQGQ